MLFVPGDRHDRFGKGAASGADLVVLDLEDAVGVSDKVEARERVATWLDHNEAVVRVNAPGSAWADEDVAALAGRAGLLAVMLPKAETAEAVREVGDVCGAPVLPLVETALGVHRVHEVAAAPGVVRLAFGSVDLALDLDCTEAWEPLLAARSALVLASRVAGLPSPTDGVTTALDDVEMLERDARSARALGFGGKLCLHPRQVAPVNQTFSPSADELAWASAVLDLPQNLGVTTYKGQMIDAPVLARARLLVQRAAE